MSSVISILHMRMHVIGSALMTARYMIHAIDLATYMLVQVIVCVVGEDSGEQWPDRVRHAQVSI